MVEAITKSVYKLFSNENVCNGPGYSSWACMCAAARLRAQYASTPNAVPGLVENVPNVPIGIYLYVCWYYAA